MVVSLTRARSINIVKLVIKQELLNRVRDLYSISVNL